jgi:TRAP-type C4-dicarboxylate transport system substrate-binding protein
MTLKRRQLLHLAAGTVAAPAILRIGRAQAAERLKLHHFLPPTSAGHVDVLTPWAERVEAASDGAIRVRIYPSMQLGGTPPQLFDQARDGVADIVWTLPGNTPGRFPRLEVFELPFLPARSGAVTSRALQEFAAGQAQDEFKEVHPIFFWAHDQGVVHANREVHKLEDLKGLKLRFPTRLAGEGLTALGADAIGMPIPQLPEALAQGVVNGCVIPWEVVPSLKIHELVEHHTELSGSPTFYTATFVLAMNKARYEGLPAELRQVLDAHSGLEQAAIAGAAWDKASGAAREKVAQAGNEIFTLPEDEVARWRQATQPVVDAWVKATPEGEQLLEQARALIAKYGQA